jgi:UMP-CMP kinase 2
LITIVSGKTTLTETLEKKLEATGIYSLPCQLKDLRKVFDALPEIIRRAYYCIGNYIVAIQVAKECQHKAVIMDRYSIAFYDRKPPQWYTD